MTMASILVSLSIGAILGWAASQYRITKAQTDRREFRMLVKRPVDLEPCEFTGTWVERS